VYNEFFLSYSTIVNNTSIKESRNSRLIIVDEGTVIKVELPLGESGA
jgi:hypothetical protein